MEIVLSVFILAVHLIVHIQAVFTFLCLFELSNQILIIRIKYLLLILCLILLQLIYWRNLLLRVLCKFHNFILILLFPADSTSKIRFLLLSNLDLPLKFLILCCSMSLIKMLILIDVFQCLYSPFSSFIIGIWQATLTLSSLIPSSRIFHVKSVDELPIAEDHVTLIVRLSHNSFLVVRI